MFHMHRDSRVLALALALVAASPAAHASALRMDLQATVPVDCRVTDVSLAPARQAIIIDLDCNAERFSLSFQSQGRSPSVSAASVRYGSAAIAGEQVRITTSRPGSNTVTVELGGETSRIALPTVRLEFAG